MAGEWMPSFAASPTCVGSDETWQVHHADALDLLGALPEGAADLVLTDPPYDARTHAKQRTNGRRQRADETVDLGFTAISFEQLREIARLCGRAARRWVIINTSYQLCAKLEEQPPDGLVFVRQCVWRKRGGMPQRTGDRPGMGWEAIAVLHRAGVKLAWNGHGRDGVFEHPVARGGHPNEKPLGLGAELVDLFSDPWDVVLDPYCGSGAYLAAALRVGRRAVGCDLDPEWAARAARRCS